MRYTVRKNFVYEIDDALSETDAIDQVDPNQVPNDVTWEAYESEVE